MQLHNLKRKTKNKKKRIVGRGGKHAKTSGRGTKGQKARSGRKLRPQLRDIIKKLPKRRGRGKNIFQSFEKKPVVLNVGDLSVFSKGDVITPKTLTEKGLVGKTRKMNPRIKILSKGDIGVALTFKDCLISEAAKVKIEGAGGVIQ